MGLVDKIKADAKKSGSNKGKFIYFREGTKLRVRFLQDMDDGMEVTFHDSHETFLVRSILVEIVLIVMMILSEQDLSIFGLYGIMKQRKYSYLCFQ